MQSGLWGMPTARLYGLCRMLFGFAYGDNHFVEVGGNSVLAGGNNEAAFGLSFGNSHCHAVLEFEVNIAVVARANLN